MIIGIWSSSKTTGSSKEFFLSGRNVPWWVLGISMVATTFSADTPNLVTDIVRTNGVSGNWVWWVMLLTGMLTVFLFSKLWRKANIDTDLEFYEIRYSGKTARFLRAFRALYLGFLINAFIMATVSLAAIKISGILLGLSPFQTILIAGGITVIYSALGGLKSVLITDLLQFLLSISGAFFAAYYALEHPSVGGLDAMLSHELLTDKLRLLPDLENKAQWISLILIPFAIQWWSTWYPGAEPGGGGYIAQRMLAARNQNDSMYAVYLFNIAHYALRPWPWIIVALASIIVFPEIGDIQKAFPGLAEASLGEDLAYPAMLSFLPSGILGLVITSLVAAYMSTISTHLNWGASYITLDFYKRYLKQDSSEKELVWVGRISTVILMIFSSILALYLQNALKAFHVLLLIGAGTGLIYILRWFRKEIHAGAELAAMIISFSVAIYLEYLHPEYFGELNSEIKLLMGVGLTTGGWLFVSLFFGKNKESDWKAFLSRLQLDEKSLKRKMGTKLLAMFLSCTAVYSMLFTSGYLIYGWYDKVWISALVLLLSVFGIFRLWNKVLIN